MRYPLGLLLAMIWLTAWVAGCGGDDESTPTVGGETPRAEETVGEETATPSPAVVGAGEVDDVSESRAPVPGTPLLFYRVSFGTETQRLPRVGGDITWETGRKGVARYDPGAGEVDIVKTITSPSYAKSAIYPVILNGRLFTIRDWGSDWTSKNNHFGIEEIDPSTGSTLSRTDIQAEWFTILGDNIFFLSEVKRDLFGKVSGGGHLMIKELGSAEDRQLAASGSRFYAVDGKLISVADSELREHDPLTGEVRRTRDIDVSQLDGTWPSANNLLYSDDAIYWATLRDSGGEIEIVRLPPEGSPEVLFTVPIEQDNTSFVIDQDQSLIVVGLVGSAPPRGLGIQKIFLFDMDDNSLETLETAGHIPLAQQAAGGGFQLLVIR